MPVTITLKNIPDAVYEQLKFAAEAHHRSLDSEVIACLETVLLPVKKTSAEHLARARLLRSQLGSQIMTAADISELKEQGRT